RRARSSTWTMPLLRNAGSPCNGRERQCHSHELLRALPRLALERPAAARHQAGARGHADNMDWAEPVGNVWTDSKAAWVKIDPELVNLPKGSTVGRGIARPRFRSRCRSGVSLDAPCRRSTPCHVPRRGQDGAAFESAR